MEPEDKLSVTVASIMLVKKYQRTTVQALAH